MRRQALLTALATSFLLPPALATAQLATEKKWKRGPNTRQLGFLYLTPRISLQRFGTDTNVYIQANDPVQDTNLAATGSLEVFIPVGRKLRLIGTGFATPTFYASESDQSSVDTGLLGRAELDLGPFTLFGGAGTSRAKQRSSPDIDQRLWHTEDTYSAGLSTHFTKRFTLSGMAEWRTYTYDEGESLSDLQVKNALDRDSRRVTGELSYILTRRTTILGRAEVIDDEFLGATGSRSGDTVRSYRYLGGFAFTAGAFDGQILAGVQSFPSDQPGDAPPYSGPTLEIGLGTPFLFGSRLQLTADREVHYAVTRSRTGEGSERNSYVWGHYGASTSFELPLGLAMRPSLYYDRASYLLPYTEVGQTVERTDTAWRPGIALLKRFGARVAVGGTFEYQQRSSNLAGYDFKATRWGLTAEIWP